MSRKPLNERLVELGLYDNTEPKAEFDFNDRTRVFKLTLGGETAKSSWDPLLSDHDNRFHDALDEIEMLRSLFAKMDKNERLKVVENIKKLLHVTAEELKQAENRHWVAKETAQRYGIAE